jgi:hypothetical protein
MRVIGVFHAPGIAFVQTILNLHADFSIGEIGQKAELTLGHFAGWIGQHGCIPFNQATDGVTA